MCVLVLRREFHQQKKMHVHCTNLLLLSLSQLFFSPPSFFICALLETPAFPPPYSKTLAFFFLFFLCVCVFVLFIFVSFMVYSLKVSKCAIMGETCVFYPHHYSLFSEYCSFFPVVVIRLFLIPHLYSYSFLVLSFLSFFFRLFGCFGFVWRLFGVSVDITERPLFFFFSVSLLSFFSITLSYASPIFQFELFSLFNMLAVI